MTVYFIADLHLSEARPDLTELFLHFIYGEAEKAQAVYILGDLFDFWIGDDERSVLTDTVKQAIRHLTGREVKCYFIHGNRDFLLGKRFAAETGMILLPEYQTVDLFGRKTLTVAEPVGRYGADLLIHGHTHRQNIHRNDRFTRIVLGDWKKDRASILKIDEHGFGFI